MANELQPLSLLFQNRLFRIPDYQRGYAWQQRLTTFIIILNEIVEFTRSLEENTKKLDEEIVLGYDTLKDIVAKYICQHRPPNNQITTYVFGYEVDNPSADYLRYRVFNEAYLGTVNETYYTKNLKYAKTFFRENLLDLYGNEGLEGLSNLYLKLTNLELLKNRLIYLTTLYSDEKFDEMDKANLRKQINDAWKEVYYQLGRNEKTPLSDDEFLRAHWISYFAYSRKKGDDYIHFLLNKFSAKNIFEKKTVIVGNTIQEFSDDIVYDAEIETVDDIEQIIGTKLCKSAHNYSAYWQPSKTHTISNTILDSRYKISSVDLTGKRINLEKK